MTKLSCLYTVWRLTIGSHLNGKLCVKRQFIWYLQQIFVLIWCILEASIVMVEQLLYLWRFGCRAWRACRASRPRRRARSTTATAPGTPGLTCAAPAPRQGSTSVCNTQILYLLYLFYCKHFNQCYCIEFIREDFRANFPIHTSDADMPMCEVDAMMFYEMQSIL